ncbi:MAG: DUF4330 family protein, partial [Oscillospiraceae bacterium]|nr:DUF4330 family protein [Oscillospiraceae bacterium]
ELIDSVRGYRLGTAEAVEVTPAIVYTEDVLAGEIRETENPEHEDIIITVAAEGTETDTALIVDGGYKLKAGNPISIKGAGYAISGYITYIERS